MEDTQSDYVEFSDLYIEFNGHRVHRLCGSEDKHMHHIIRSEGNVFRVIFKSNDVYDATGFRATYIFIKGNDDCTTHMDTIIF